MKNKQTKICEEGCGIPMQILPCLPIITHMQILVHQQGEDVFGIIQFVPYTYKLMLMW